MLQQLRDVVQSFHKFQTGMATYMQSQHLKHDREYPEHAGYFWIVN